MVRTHPYCSWISVRNDPHSLKGREVGSSLDVCHNMVFRGCGFLFNHPFFQFWGTFAGPLLVPLDPSLVGEDFCPFDVGFPFFPFPALKGREIGSSLDVCHSMVFRGCGFLFNHPLIARSILPILGNLRRLRRRLLC